MHGFFVDNRLYEKAKVLTDPFAYETYRAQRIQKKIDEERKSRISLVRKLPKVRSHCIKKRMYWILCWRGIYIHVVVDCALLVVMKACFFKLNHCRSMPRWQLSLLHRRQRLQQILKMPPVKLLPLPLVSPSEEESLWPTHWRMTVLRQCSKRTSL